MSTFYAYLKYLQYFGLANNKCLHFMRTSNISSTLASPTITVYILRVPQISPVLLPRAHPGNAQLLCRLYREFPHFLPPKHERPGCVHAWTCDRAECLPSVNVCMYLCMYVCAYVRAHNNCLLVVYAMYVCIYACMLMYVCTHVCVWHIATCISCIHMNK